MRGARTIRQAVLTTLLLFVLLVGEAAHQNNPFSGGGIMNALEGAAEAAEVLAGALGRGNTSARALKPYDERWAKKMGHSISKYAMLRKIVYRLSDKEIDKLAEKRGPLRSGSIALSGVYAAG